MEETRNLSLIRKLDPANQDTIFRGAVRISGVTHNAGNLERTFNPDELRETLTEWIARPIAHVHYGSYRVNFAL
jgi:hypothetical protein